MRFKDISGVPEFIQARVFEKRNKYCLLIPVRNENGRIQRQLETAKKAGIDKIVDIVICDGESTDGSLQDILLNPRGVCAVLVKIGPGKQGAQLRTGIYWALQEGYSGVLTIDGNNKDSIEDIPKFIEKLDAGYDFVQGSRFIKGGRAVNTPIVRYLAVRLLHAPLISLSAKQRFTDTTNAFRAYSRKYLEHPAVLPLRDVFVGYELLAYLNIRATQLGLRACEVPVARTYPKNEPVPTKIKGFSGNMDLLTILFKNMRGEYNP